MTQGRGCGSACATDTQNNATNESNTTLRYPTPVPGPPEAACPTEAHNCLPMDLRRHEAMRGGEGRWGGTAAEGETT